MNLNSRISKVLIGSMLALAFFSVSQVRAMDEGGEGSVGTKKPVSRGLRVARRVDRRELERRLDEACEKALVTTTYRETVQKAIEKATQNAGKAIARIQQHFDVAEKGTKFITALVTREPIEAKLVMDKLIPEACQKVALVGPTGISDLCQWVGEITSADGLGGPLYQLVAKALKEDPLVGEILQAQMNQLELSVSIRAAELEVAAIDEEIAAYLPQAEAKAVVLARQRLLREELAECSTHVGLLDQQLATTERKIDLAAADLDRIVAERT